MRRAAGFAGALAALRPSPAPLSGRLRHGFFTRAGGSRLTDHIGATVPAALATAGLFVWWLYPSDDFARLSPPRWAAEDAEDAEGGAQGDDELDAADAQQEPSAWTDFARRFESVSRVSDLEWSQVSDRLVGLILPEWSKALPGYVRKLQRELSMSPGSLADDIWREAHDPDINPEIRCSARVRVSPDLCDEEKEYLARRRRVVGVALAKYLGLDERNVHPDDVPTIAMCGSGGGLRALIAGTGSLLAADGDGLFDCVTYTAGVSGSCWLQALHMSSLAGSMGALLEHLKARAGTHIAYPPVAFHSLISLPTSRCLLSGLVEKLKGDAKADVGLVDVYGLLLGARYLVPRGELGVNERDFKLSNQRDYVKLGQRPLPIYTLVRHEIPDAGDNDKDEERPRDPWFQWFEITPYEFFCEEFGAGIPTWAMGRRFKNGSDVPPEDGFHLPEIRVPLLMGMFGSAFCATLSHYYKEIRPVVRGLAGFKAVDDMVSGRDDDLVKVHPIDPASIPNFAYGMYGRLAGTTPRGVYAQEYMQLMDAGMSNNLPIYPLLRPGRDVDVLIAFDASADIKTDNWLSVADGYARQRGIRGWPVGIGWPKAGQPVEQTTRELAAASEAETVGEADRRVREAQASQAALRAEARRSGGDAAKDDDDDRFAPADKEAGDLGYCTVWVGTTQERCAEQPARPSKRITEANAFHLMEPDAGIAVVYLPLLANEKVPGISPGSSEFLSTWNFVYTAEQIDGVVRLARANYDEGRQRVRATVRAVYERKKQRRERAEGEARERALRQRAAHALVGGGDQFS